MGSYYHYRPIFSVVSVCHSVHRGYPCTGPHPSVQGSGTIHPVQGPSSDPSPSPLYPLLGMDMDMDIFKLFHIGPHCTQTPRNV